MVFTIRRARASFGLRAEKLARKRLRQLDYRIIESNHRNRAGEIDVIAEQGGTLCFIEVKARSTTEYGDAAAAVDHHKRDRLRRAASLYLALKPFQGPCRFDVVALDRREAGWHLEVIENAF